MHVLGVVRNDPLLLVAPQRQIAQRQPWIAPQRRELHTWPLEAQMTIERETQVPGAAQQPDAVSHDFADAALPEIGPAAQAVCDAIGDLMAFWGFQRSHGRIWALLFLMERELHAGELAATLGLSSGQVSMALRDLDHWGAIHRAHVAGSRRTWYRPETNLFRMVSRVFRERELEQIRTLARTLQQARAELQTSGRRDGAVEFRLRRIEGLIAAAELGRSFVERLVAGTLLPRAVLAALDRAIAD